MTKLRTLNNNEVNEAVGEYVNDWYPGGSYNELTLLAQRKNYMPHNERGSRRYNSCPEFSKILSRYMHRMGNGKYIKVMRHRVRQEAAIPPTYIRF